MIVLAILKNGVLWKRGNMELYTEKLFPVNILDICTFWEWSVCRIDISTYLGDDTTDVHNDDDTPPPLPPKGQKPSYT